MRTASFVGAAVALGAAAAFAEPFQLAGTWWQEPAVQTRHTTLVAGFDSTETSDADFAREMPLAGGFGMAADVPGKNGSATQVAEAGGHLNFVGGSNLQAAHGTVRMLVKGDVWADETPRWLFEARAVDRIGIRREPGKLSLVFSPGRRTDQAIAQLDLEIGDVSAAEWHSVVASWDRDSGTGWIALDGNGVSGEMAFSQDFRPAFALYLAGGFGGRAGGMNLPGLTIDDFVLYDVPLPLLETELAALPHAEEEFLPIAEAGARKSLDFIADLQRWGGWQTIYTWPTLLGSSAQGREYVDFDDYLDNDKGNGSPRTAINFLYAYEVLGDYRYLDVGLRTGEFLLAAQDERGFWVHGYRTTVNGIQPVASDRHIKFQDQVQAHPMFLLSALYRLTGDERYMEAVKRAGEFYLAAQNPNGSWSHHFNAEKGIGENAIGQPQGGELNDGAMNDAIDIMAFLYHVTGEGKYVQAINGAGDWLIEAQGDEVPLWADQYDGDNNPAWARAFEPPAYSTTATRLACQALREVCRFSGDERYLEPMRRTVTWLEANAPDDKLSSYTEPGTGKAIAAWERKIYYLDDPDQVAYLNTQPIGVWYLQKVDMTGPIKRILEQAEAGAPATSEVTIEGALASLPGSRTGAQSALDTQNKAGVWVVPNVATFMGSVGAGFSACIPRVLLILRYIEAARIAKGELEPIHRGAGDLRAMAYPEPDWYELKWTENVE
jgi:hypothetical protein